MEQYEEKAFGKTFRPGRTIDPEYLAKANAMLEEFAARAPEMHPADLPERFRDDLAGTEYDQWYREREAQRQQAWAEQRQQER
ncbi:hypothetical protein OHA40_21955 [Nocardia sp. NBC_00508]|uniref:hypothetical protein n=1 Tax=Nocardia sp. NBC_00508 TaxID=2975992 RepID=UPI002E81A294|nr:hypothetical protein [Nocardia sp. NBC_00508]WUD64357.1 hypothetical protein OHA40_21955 [Nocardia sp. NBC_00508]